MRLWGPPRVMMMTPIEEGVGILGENRGGGDENNSSEGYTDAAEGRGEMNIGLGGIVIVMIRLGKARESV